MNTKEQLDNIKRNIFVINNYNTDIIEDSFNNLKLASYDSLIKLGIEKDLNIIYLKDKYSQLLVFNIDNNLAYMEYQDNDLSMFADDDQEILKFANSIARHVVIYFEEINKKMDSEHIHIRKKVEINKKEKVKKYKK